jgi:2-polyprenyl-6-methoxyphenol hydroxylase-like FAD-dependent oxidoreductase
MQAGTNIRPRPTGDHAVVLGASMGGLAAARVLADAYKRVTVVDRDTLPVPGVQRRGVPQGRHAHGLLARGREALEELLPGLTDELVARGALYGDVQLQGRWYNEGVRLRQAPSGLNSLAVSRPLLEGQVRRRLAAFSNVSIVDGCDVAGLVATADGRRVSGVRTIGRTIGGGAETLTADLVVDATGRGSRSPVWLEALGYRRPEREQVRIHGSYATAMYRRRQEHLTATAW